ncbi:MAG: hypothetical protein U1E65_08575 [Myxococcota bacterium]
MRAAIAFVASSGLVVACSRAPWVLEVGAEPRALILVQLSDLAPSVTAYDIDAAGPIRLPSDSVFRGRAGASLVVLSYATPLSGLGLTAGPLEVSAEGAPLPLWDGIWIGGADDAGLVRAATVPPALSAIRISGLRPAQACLDARSCFGLDDTSCRPSCEVSTTEEPVAPNPPQLTPCPSGWIAGNLSAVLGTDCEPYAVARACALAAAQFPGDPDCHPIGRACPAAAFADDLPSATVYVDPQGPAGGDGSRAAPYQSVSVGLAHAPSGGTVALAAGVYTASVSLGRGIHLRGACPERTIIRVPDRIVGIGVATASISDLSVEGGANGIRVNRGAVALRGVVVRGARAAGVLVAPGSALRAEEVVVRDTGGPGVRLQSASLDVRRAAFLGLTTAGIAATTSTVHLQGVRISGVRLAAVDTNAPAIVATESSVAATAVAFDHAIGRAYIGVGGALQLSDFWVRQVELGDDQSAAFEVRSVRVQLDRGSIFGVGRSGVRASEGTVVRGADLLVGGLRGDQPRALAGFYAATGAYALERIRVHSLGNGVELHQDDAMAPITSTITDARLVGTSTAEFPRAGISSFGPLGSCRVSRVVIEQAPNGVRLEGSALDASDLWILDAIGPAGFDVGGRGIAILEGGSVRLRRASVARASFTGIVVSAGASLDAEDLRVGEFGLSGTVGRTNNGILAVGAHLRLSRFSVNGATGVGLSLGKGALSLDVKDGSFLNNAVAVELGAALDPAVVLRQVRYRGNLTDWRFIP